MNNELKQKWIDVLRSDKYVQITGQLADKYIENGRCCLGVLADVAELEIGNEGMSIMEDGVVRGYDALETLVFGFVDADKDLLRVFYRMNDNEGKSFREIADYIEENVEITDV